MSNYLHHYEQNRIDKALSLFKVGTCFYYDTNLYIVKKIVTYAEAFQSDPDYTNDWAICCRILLNKNNEAFPLDYFTAASDTAKLIIESNNILTGNNWNLLYG